MTPALKNELHTKCHDLVLLHSGPGSYDVSERSLAQESFKKAFFERTKKGGFGTSAQRDFVFVSRESMEAPGPGQYEVRTSITTHADSFLLSHGLISNCQRHEEQCVGKLRPWGNPRPVKLFNPAS